MFFTKNLSLIFLVFLNFNFREFLLQIRNEFLNLDFYKFSPSANMGCLRGVPSCKNVMSDSEFDQEKNYQNFADFKCLFCKLIHRVIPFIHYLLYVVLFVVVLRHQCLCGLWGGK